MAGETTITVCGNLTAEPEIRYTKNGDPVVNFTVASTPRVYSKADQEWKDGDALFLRCNLWREQAENLADSALVKGARVIVVGKLKQKSYTTKEGDKRTTVELDVDEVAPSLKYATAKVEKRTKGQASQRPNRARQDADEDPWGDNE